MSYRALTAASAALAVAVLFVRADRGQARALVDHLPPGPRLVSAPGALHPFKDDTTGLQRAADQAPAEPRHRGLTTIAATDPPSVAVWDRRVSTMVRTGDLRLKEKVQDALSPERVSERYVQLHEGVPVFGGGVSRQLERGKTVSIIGSLYGDVTIDVRPALSPDDASAAFLTLAGGRLGPSRPPELMVLPTDDGSYRLTYRARMATSDDVVMTFIDAATGEMVLSFSDLGRPVR